MKGIWRTEEIVEQRIYTPNDVENQIGISADTVRRWIKQQRLIAKNGNKVCFTGQRLREAVENRI